MSEERQYATNSQGVPYLPVDETRRVMALELAVRSSGQPSVTQSILARALLFEEYVESGEVPPK